MVRSWPPCNDIVRHLAFRDCLRQNADVARAYDQEKARCQRLHPNDSHAYGDCKDRLDQRG
ncbi:GrpB family protein [Cupriavidus sp. 2MCAB6]|uniref:GrpB family protein n=1 Tax=Cupriavidus sp. 2MCAB6 TaxID=3232981 RepID=UPI003F928084